MFRTKKFLAGGIIALIVYLLISFYHPLVCLVIKTVLAHKFQSVKEGTVSCKTLGFLHKGFYIEGLSIHHLQGAIASIDITRVECQWHEGEPVYKILRPLITYDEDKVCLNSSTASLYDMCSKMISKMQILEGQVLCKSKRLPKVLTFSVDQDKADSHVMVMQVGENEHQYVKLTLHQLEQAAEFDVRLDKSPIQYLASLMMKFSPDLPSFEAGTVSGYFQCTLDAHHSPYQIKSDLTVCEGKWHTALFSFYMPEVHVRAEMPFKEISLASLLEQMTLSLECHKMKMAMVNPVSSAVWEFTEVDATIMMNIEEPLVLDLRGALYKDQQRHPFSLQGHGEAQSLEYAWMEIDLEVASMQEESTRSSIYGAWFGSGNLLLKTHFDKFKASEISIIQDLLVMVSPQLQSFEILEGSVSADVVCSLENHRLHSIAFEHVTCEQIKAKWLHPEWEAHCELAEGRYKWYAPSSKLVKAPSWEVAFKKLNLRKEGVDECIESEGTLSSKDRKLIPSWMNISWAGLKARCHIAGPYSAIDLAATLTFEENHYYSLLQKEVIGSASHLRSLGCIDLSCKIGHLVDKVTLAGGGYLDYGQDVVDKIRFSVEMPLYAQDLLAGLQEIKGWAQSDKLSEHTYLWLLRYYKQRWNVFGDMKVSAEFNADRMQFSLETEAAMYDSEDIQVVMPYKEKGYQGQFAFDYVSKAWKIDLPLEEITCQDKRLHLPFKDVFAHVFIEGTKLKAEQVRANCEGVAFTGWLELDFKDIAWIALKIYPQTMEAQAEQLITFLRYIPEFKQLDIPLQGDVQGIGEGFLEVHYNDRESKKITKIGLRLQNAVYAFNEYGTLKDLGLDLYFDSAQNSLEVKEIQGSLQLKRGGEQKNYRLNVQNLVAKDLLKGEWDFDIRLEAPTFDILRIMGCTHREEDKIALHLEEQQTHFLGSRFQIGRCLFSERLVPLELNVKVMAASVDIVQQLQWFYLWGFGDIEPMLLQTLKNLKVEGDIACEMTYHGERDHSWKIRLGSELISCEQWKFPDCMLEVEKEGSHVQLKMMKMGNFQATGAIVYEDPAWKIQTFDARLGSSLLCLQQGTVMHQAVAFDKVSATIVLEEMYSLLKLPDNLSKFFQGDVQVEGKLKIGCEGGLEDLQSVAELQMHADNITQAGLQMATTQPLQLRYGHKDGWHCEAFHMELSKKTLHEVWSKLSIHRLEKNKQEGVIKGQKIKLTIPPEMVMYLTESELIPWVCTKEKQLIVGGRPFTWDNQIDTDLELSYDKGVMTIRGVLKEGYYWCKEQAFYLQKCHYVISHDQCTIFSGIDYQGVAMDILTKIQFKEEAPISFFISEGHEDQIEQRHGLEIVVRSTQEEGVVIQSVEGELCGIECALRRNPRAYAPYEMVLSGQMKIDTSGLVKAFPQMFYQTMKDLGMGKGYELSGDLIISKTDVTASYFKGFLKGRDFEFLGCYFKTLLSEVDIDYHKICIHDLSLSDPAGVLHIKESTIERGVEGWAFSAPEVQLQDFRPSSLKKSEGHEEKIKPFIIKDLHFCEITGILGKGDSFTGKGYLNFVNTFKRDYNLLDIPIEIIGRLGFDLGLFVPVIGRLELEMSQGKIFLKELKNAYSEGKRSRFYLSGYKDSYIGLDGSVFIDIKMKQYVLLKITEPFTLSIRGSLLKPKYSLR